MVRGSVERELLREMAVIGVEVMVNSEEHDLGEEAPISEGERREKEDDIKGVDNSDKIGLSDNDHEVEEKEFAVKVVRHEEPETNIIKGNPASTVEVVAPPLNKYEPKVEISDSDPEVEEVKVVVKTREKVVNLEAVQKELVGIKSGIDDVKVVKNEEPETNIFKESPMYTVEVVAPPPNKYIPEGWKLKIKKRKLFRI